MITNTNDDWEKILNAFDDGIFIVDGDLNTLFVNKSYERITGLKLEQVIGKTAIQIYKEGLTTKSTSMQVKSSNSPVSLVKKYESGKSALVTGIPIFDSNNNLSRIVVTVRDLTELNELHEKLNIAESRSQYFQELQMSCTKNIIAHSPSMQRVLSLAVKTAELDSTVLITGETGVGKEVIATLIHETSSRAKYPFIKINCAAIPDELAEAELFGYEEGAFTGAKRSGKPGVFELAHKGTVFLDEISELSLSLQSKFLRVLQELEVTRVGGTKTIKVDFRVIAATNRSLRKMVEEGTFRNDVYYRINVMNIEIPPLRDRKQDIPHFISMKLKQLIAKYHRKKTISPEVIEILKEYSWPGNVRELENVIERLFIASDSDILDRGTLMRVISLPGVSASNSPETNSLVNRIESYEKEILLEALSRCKTKKEAATWLGIDPATMTRKCQKYNIRI